MCVRQPLLDVAYRGLVVLLVPGRLELLKALGEEYSREVQHTEGSR